MTPNARCRGCGAELTQMLIDLGAPPPSNAYLSAEALDAMEPTYPLRAMVCSACFLVQVTTTSLPEALFTPDYAYFSSFSDSWLAHSRAYVAHAVERLQLGAQSRVVEVASNDGYLLQYVVERGIPAIGIEPTRDAAQAAIARGVPTEMFFLGEATAKEFVGRHGLADLAVANNVLAHVPDLHDFVAGLAVLIGERGTLTIEFPHVLELLRHTQFDTIYHEHFSYFSLIALNPVFARHGLAVIDVEKLSTHGGSLRLWLRGARAGSVPTTAPDVLRAEEEAFGLRDLATYASFGERVLAVKRGFLRFLLDAQERGERVCGYGAAAKGNTLLNYCGVRPDLIAFVADRNPHKAGKWMPASRIPIRDPQAIFAERPDYVVIFPWNIRDEVMEQLADIRMFGGRFVTAVPELVIHQ